MRFRNQREHKVLISLKKQKRGGGSICPQGKKVCYLTGEEKAESENLPIGRSRSREEEITNVSGRGGGRRVNSLEKGRGEEKGLRFV